MGQASRHRQPSVYKSVKVFLRLVAAEQLQATPFFVDRLTQCSHLDKKLRNSDRAIGRFVIACDQAYFKLPLLVYIDLGTWDRLRSLKSYVSQ